MSCTGPEGDILLDFLQSPLNFLDRLVQSYGGSVGLRLGGEHVVLLTDPKLCREVLIDQADTFRKVIVNMNSPCLQLHRTSYSYSLASTDALPHMGAIHG